MRRLILASAVLLFNAGAASAQMTNLLSDTLFRGIRVEGNIGGDRYRSLGSHNDKLGYGATLGFDGVIGNRLVIGPEGTFWRARDDSGNCTTDGAGRSLCDRSRNEYGAAVRIGLLLTPHVLVFGKGGYVHNDQRQVYTSSTAYLYQNGQIVGPGYTYVTNRGTDGWQAGGGVELSLTNMFYVDAQYVHARYDDDTGRDRVMGGIGIRFK